MKLISLFTLFAVAISVSSPSAKPAASAKRTPSKVSSFALLYTASARGQIRSCNCSKFRFGGYGRELTLLKSVRQKNPDILLLEGGDITGGSGFQAGLKSDVAAKALKALGYAAMIPGEEELGVRGTRYVGRFGSQSSPIICANLYKDGTDKPIYAPYTIKNTKNGLRVALVGLIAPDAAGPFLGKQYGESVKDPAQILKSVIPGVRQKADVVAVIFHGQAADAEKLASQQGVDLIVASHCSTERPLFPEKGKSEMDAPVKKVGGAYIINAETRTNWSLGQLYITLQSGKIKAVKHKLTYLDRSFEEDPQMVKIYDDYNEKVKQAVLASGSKIRQDMEAILIKRGIKPEEVRTRLRKSPFVTSEQCKTCHEDICRSWEETRHAHAMSTLEKVKQEYDPECVGCHATGVVVRNGYVNQKETPELANIQCEACHGAGEAHVKSPAKGYGDCGESTCRSCHTDERDPEFDFAIAWGKIKH